jgi:glutaredoxin-related protein
MITRVAKAAIMAAVLAAIVASVPDLKRYLELRDM